MSVKVRTRILFEVSAKSTSVLLDWNSARSFLVDLQEQMETSEIIRVNVKCVNTYSMISNYPLSRQESKNLINDLGWYVEENS